MKFFTNKQAGVKVTPIFENEAYESKLLEYTKERELFSGKLNEVYANLPFNGEKEILLGLGKKEELVEDKVREVFFKLVKVLESNKELEVFVTLPKVESVSTEKLVNAAVEGALHATYKFDKYKSDRKDFPEITINLTTEEQLENLKEKIKNELQLEKVELNNLVDKSLLGGLKLTYNNKVVDASVRAKLNAIKTKISTI